jgi:hypothetical protein
MNEPRPPVPPQGQPQHGGHHPPSQSGPPKIAGMPVQAVRKDDPNLAPLSLVDEPAPPPGTAAPVSKIKAFGVAGIHAQHTYKRPTTATGTGAVRVRTFHGRLSDEGLAFMDDKINEWLDQHPEIEVKFASTSIGQYEGKIKEPALIMNVWY